MPLRRIAVICLLSVLSLAAPAAANLRAHDFATRVGLPAAAAARAGFVTPVQHARPFDLVGFHWRGTAGAVAVRAHRRSGWTPWLALDPDQPAWTGRADAYQLRMTHRPQAIRAHFVEITGRRRVLARAAVGGEPAIVPRSSWDPGNQCPPRAAPVYGRVDLAFVHDTVSPNDYSEADSAAIVLAICRFHRNGNGWNDIGYNFLVDRYGQLFEGRAGGIDEPVIGAQAQGYNQFSTSVSAIGTYDRTSLPSAAVQSIARLLAWKLALTGTPPEGTIVEATSGGSLNRYAAGTQVTLNRIAGHRDGDATDCPGNALYSQLPDLRRLTTADIAALGPISRLAGAPGRNVVTFPSGTIVSGKLLLPDEPAGGQTIALQRQDGPVWTTVAQTPTQFDGSWSIRLSSAWSHNYRAYWAGDATHPALTAPIFGLYVVPRITVTAAATRIHAGSDALLSGTVAPAKLRVLVDLARKTRGAYAAAATLSRGTSRGAFSIAILLRKPGLYRMTVRALADRHNSGASAVPVFVRVVSRRVSLAPPPGGGAPGG